MNIRHLITAATASMLAASSFATEYTNFPIEPSKLTRAQVLAELEVARATGELDDPSAEYAAFTHEEIASTRHRADAYAASKRPRRSNTGNYVGG